MIPDAEQQPVMSVPEVARALGVSRSKAYELVAAGVWPSLRWGRSIVVPVARLRLMLGLSTSNPAAADDD